ncbi:MAG TPA: hypothetical protein VGO93_24885 [Candidatus Xenobia bacterium]
MRLLAGAQSVVENRAPRVVSLEADLTAIDYAMSDPGPPSSRYRLSTYAT